MNSKRIILLLASLLFLATTAQAITFEYYNIEILDSPQSYDYVSPNSTSHQLVNLTYDGEPVTPENLDADNGVFFYNYPAASSENKTMEYIKNGIWAAELDTNTSDEDINYTLKNATEESQQIWAENSQLLTASQMDLEKVTTINDPVKADKEITFRANLTNVTDDSQISDANVEIRFVNGTYSTEVVNIGYNDEDNLYRTSLDIPDHTDQTFIGQLTADKGDQSTSYSFRINTKKAIDGFVDYVRSSDQGCMTGDLTSDCEGGANVETGFNVTDDTAQNVELSVIKQRNDGTEEVHEEISLSRDDSIASDQPGYYTGSFEFPYINRTQYRNQVKLMYNASSDNRRHIVNRTIDYRSFRSNIDLEKGYAYQSGEMKIPLTLERYFSLNTVPEEDIRTLEVNITDSNGDQFTTYSFSNVTLDTDEQYTETVDIPGDAPIGDYQIDMFIEDIYHANNTLVREFSVRENEQTFELSDNTLEPEFQRTGQFETTMNITDISGTGLNIVTEVSDDLEDIVELPSSFEMDQDEERQLTLEWNISQVQSHTGEIQFTDEDSNYNRTIDVETQSPNCYFQDGNLCSLSDQDINYLMEERTTDETRIEIMNIGEEGSEREVSLSISGNISDYAGVQEEYEFGDTQTIPINFTPEERGVFTGTLTIDSLDSTLEYNIELDSDVPSGAANADITDNINLGSLVEGESAEAEIEIENIGEVDITNITLSSSTYSIESDTQGMEISPGSTSTVQIDFEDVESDSGELEVTLEALKQSTETVSVSADVYSDYGTRIDDLFSDIQNLRDETGSQEALSTLDDAETQLDSAEISWESGDYQEAVDSYEEADQIYSEAQRTVESESSDPQDPGTSPGGSDPGTQQPEDSGGLPIIPIIFITVLLIGGGFVFYESYIPEEGDPLYDVLGQ